MGYIYDVALAWPAKSNCSIDVQHWLFTLYCYGDKQLAGLILAVQDVYLDSGIDCPNCAFWGPLIFDQKSRRHIKHARGLSEAGFNKVLQKLDIYILEIEGLVNLFIQQQLLWSNKILQHYLFFRSRVSETKNT